VFLTATNYDVSIQQKVTATVEESGAMLISSRLLVEMLTLLSEEFVAFSSVRPDVVTVTGGTCRYDIKCLPAKHYPKPVMPFPEETVKLNGICSLARRTVFAVSKDDSKPALQCVSVKLRHNAVHAAACDGMRLMLIKESAGSPDEREFLLPGWSLQILASISSDNDVFEVGDVGNEVVFTRADMMLSMKKLPGEYIDTTAILKGITPAYTATADAGKIKEALGLLAVSAEEEPVNLAFTGGNIVITRNSDYSEASAAVTASVTKETPGAGFFYSLKNLCKLFQVVDGRVRLELDAKGMMLVKTRSEVYMELPRRVPVKKAEKVSKADKTQKAA
jgi:DNA polymerase-3 subunit beta